MMKEEDKNKPVEDQPQSENPTESGEAPESSAATPNATEEKIKEVSSKLFSDVSNAWGQALGKALIEKKKKRAVEMSDSDSTFLNF